MFHFGYIKSQLQYSPGEELLLSRNRTVVLLGTLRNLLKTYKPASKSSEVPLPRTTLKFGYTLSKDNIFAH